MFCYCMNDFNHDRLCMNPCLRCRCDIRAASPQGEDRAPTEWGRTGEGNKERHCAGSTRGRNGSSVCHRPGRDGGRSWIISPIAIIIYF